MSTQILYIEGVGKWVKPYPGQEDTKYGKKAVMELYPNEKGILQLKAAGWRKKFYESEDGQFIKLSRDVDKEFKDQPLGHPKVVDAEGKPFDRLIGNGSKVVAKIALYDSRMGKGARWEALQVVDLVPYEKITDEGAYPF